MPSHQRKITSTYDSFSQFQSMYFTSHLYGDGLPYTAFTSTDKRPYNYKMMAYTSLTELEKIYGSSRGRNTKLAPLISISYEEEDYSLALPTVGTTVRRYLTSTSKIGIFALSKTYICGKLGFEHTLWRSKMKCSRKHKSKVQ